MGSKVAVPCRVESTYDAAKGGGKEGGRILCVINVGGLSSYGEKAWRLCLMYNVCMM